MSEPQKKLFKCNYPGCDMVFTKKCVLRDHKLAHEKKKPYECEICGKTFTQKGNLKTHKKSHSTNHQGFKCPYPDCNKSFVTNSYLKIHIKSHKGQKECVCTYPGCGKKFYHRGNLKYHENKKHPDLKKIFPFECLHSNCNKKFKTMEEKMAHHYEAEPDCLKEKNFLLDLFVTMVTEIRGEGSKEANDEVNEIYKDCLSKLNGKNIVTKYMEDKGIKFNI